jgi:hypothetical protein
MRRQIFLLSLLIVVFAIHPLLATERAEIGFSSLPTLDDNQVLNVELRVNNRSEIPIKDIRIFYRDVSQNYFQSAFLKPQGFRYLASVDLSDFEGSVVEYYFGVEYVDGALQTYPDEAPEYGLYEVALQDEDTGTDDGSVEVISPEPDEVIYTDEFMLTVSYFQYSGTVDKERTKLYLDTWDVSQYLNIFDDFLTFAPNKVPPGRHKIRLELYDRSGNLLATKTVEFSAIARKGPSPVGAGRKINFSGNAFAQSRYEELADGASIERYVDGGLRLNANGDQYSFGARLYISNQENDNTQYINRFTGWLQYDFWNNRFFRVTGGDAYPQLNPYLMQNIFVRGVHTQLYLKFVNFDFVTGNTRRSIEGTGIADTTLTPGTFKRKVWGARTSFGSGKTFQFGLSAVKGRDDPKSIEYGKDPEENLGVGSDLYFSFDKNRIIVDGNISASSYNPNILDGEDLTYEQIIDAGVDSADFKKSTYDLIKKFVTVNQYIIPIPGLAWHAQLRLNYFRNYFSFNYGSVDGTFNSLGQPFLLRDNRGFTVTDNIRLIQNQVFLTLRYMSYENNLDGIKPATTENKTIGVNLSYFPIGNLPSITIGYSNYTRDNQHTEISTKVPTPEKNGTNSINLSTSYGFLFNELDNRLTVNFMNYKREDQTVFAIDNLSNTLTIMLQTNYQIPLKTNLEFSLQQNDNMIPNNDSKLTLNTFGGGGEYRFDNLFGDEDQFTFGTFIKYGSVSSESEILPDPIKYNRFFLNGRILYRLPQYGRIILNADLVSYSGDQKYSDYIITSRYEVNL